MKVIRLPYLDKAAIINNNLKDIVNWSGNLYRYGTSLEGN